MREFLARRDGRPVGRIAAVRYPAHNRFWEDRVGFFGFFDCEDDPEAANALLDAAAAWLREQGLDTIRGPANPSTNHECGLLVDGFETDNVLMMPHNERHYERLLTGWGLAKEMDLFAWRIPSAPEGPDHLVRLAGRVTGREGFVVRNLDMSRFDAEIEAIREIYNDAWAKNWGFVPMTPAEFDHVAKDMKLIVRPEYSYLATVDGEPAAFSIGLPNIHELLKGTNGRLLPVALFRLLFRAKRCRSMRLITLGVKQKFQSRGIPAVFYLRTIVDCHRMGVEWGELSWVLETNVLMNRVVENLGAEKYKTYRMYSKPL